ncbi:thioredoxin domain-containing protein [Methylobacterium sp. CM6257]
MAGPLGDIWIGAPNAKVTFIEYAAVTCTHCADFHSEVWPGIKAHWIDTGRMRFALRGYPLNPLDTAAFMLAPCAACRTRPAPHRAAPPPGAGSSPRSISLRSLRRLPVAPSARREFENQLAAAATPARA